MEWTVIIGLFFLSAFFSGSETALMSVNKLKLETKKENGDKKAKKLLGVISKPDKLLTTILIGNNFVNILLTAMVTSLSIRMFGESSITYTTIVLTIVLLIFSEITPKSLAAVFSEKVSFLVVHPIKMLMVLLTPVSFILSKFTSFIVKMITKGQEPEASVSVDEIKTMINMAETEGVFEKEEKDLLQEVLSFKEKDIREALKTPRVNIVALDIESTYEEVREIVLENGYSRYPVYKETIDQIVGMFNVKELVRWSSEQEKPLKEYIDNEVIFVLETMNIDKVFTRMKNNKKHIAVVVDEYGGTDGLVSFEDILETLIGQDINDETDQEEVLIDELTESHIICNGMLEIETLNEVFKIKLPEENTTIAGFVANEFGEIPKVGESLNYHHLKFDILEIGNTKINKIKIIKKDH